MKTSRLATVSCLAIMMALPALTVAQQGPLPVEEVEVVATTPTPGAAVSIGRIPHRVISIDSAELDRALSTRLSDHLTRRVGGIFINEAQSNPLQPDVQYRGFTLSPLLGLPQGLSIYQDGVRLNEVFGDTMNWELLPNNAIAGISLLSGSNPLFGLNTLGGTLSIRTRNGFEHPGHQLAMDAGSFGNLTTRMESGASRGALGYFLAGSHTSEDGWRDASGTHVNNLFASLGWRPGDHSLDLTFNHADSRLTGNGPAPEVLRQLEGRAAIFTAPDITNNDLYMLNLKGEVQISEPVRLSGNLYYRSNESNSFNGDGSDFEECADGSGTEYLSEEPEDGVTPVSGGSCMAKDADNNAVDLRIADMNDAYVAAAESNAINNRSTRKQNSYGASLQMVFDQLLWERNNHLLAGLAYLDGEVEFGSTLELAMLNDDRSTRGIGKFVPDDAVRLDVDTRSYSAYLSERYSLTEQLDVTASVRYNHSSIKLRDRTGMTPRLNGSHTFSRVNPAAGLSYQPLAGLTLFGSYGESARAPTAVELACADEADPCNLPNAFLADPPLEQVVAKTGELGVRWSRAFAAELVVFHTLSKDDILFQSTGGTTSNEGFFANVGTTRRLGVEAEASGTVSLFDWSMNYAWLQATYRDSFTIPSPHHPYAQDQNVEELNVRPGNRIPGIPAHSAKAALSARLFHEQLRLGAEYVYHSSRYLRGDDANLDTTTISGYGLLNLLVEYRPLENLQIFARINNVLDKEYSTFGLYGEPGEVLDEAYLQDMGRCDDAASCSTAVEELSTRFLSPGAPVNGFVGLRLRFD